MKNPRSILITGASSGIGAALAREYAAEGRRLALTGRDTARLAAVASDCRAQGAEVAERSLDVCDAPDLSRWIAEIDHAFQLDLVIANAGISGGTGGGGEDEQQLQKIFTVNVEGVANTVHAAIAPMTRRGQGQIALMSSLAGFRGFPGAPAYCASKAAVRVWGEALRGSLHGKGICVSVICPGYVRTPMTDVNDFPMPLLMPPERAAAIIRRGLDRNKARIAFPLRLYAAVLLTTVLPPGLLDPLLRRMPEKS